MASVTPRLLRSNSLLGAESPILVSEKNTENLCFEGLKIGALDLCAIGSLISSVWKDDEGKKNDIKQDEMLCVQIIIRIVAYRR